MRTQAGKTLIWRKAAILGSIWAASEIVLGSFLHNARVPLKGELLTAIGIAILMAGRRLWPERGLLWRAGLICAAMKSVSPSAALFGPMVAISAEGLLAETGTLLLGGGAAGCMLGGGLAMTWAITHKIGNMLIFYGADTVSIYLRSLSWLRAKTGLTGGGNWTPLIVLFGLYFAGGMLAAAMGRRAGRDIAQADAASPLELAKKIKPAKSRDHKYSIALLIAHISLMAALLAAGRGLPLAALYAAAAAYAGLCAFLYPRCRSLLKRAGVWTGVLLVSLLAGLLLGSAQAGFYMAARAFILTFAFAAVGTELLNPVIRRLFGRLGGGLFFETLEYSFCALPGIMAAFPPGREIARRPVASLNRVISAAPYWLDSLKAEVFIITGGHGTGKSEFVAALAGGLKQAGKKTAGIMARGYWSGALRSGFDIVDLANGNSVPLCRRGEPGDGVKAGEFGFYRAGLAFGEAALAPEKLKGADMIFLDEVGFLELEGKGWAAALDRLTVRPGARLVIVTRDYLLDKVRGRWGLEAAVVWETGKTRPGEALAQLLAIPPAMP